MNNQRMVDVELLEELYRLANVARARAEDRNALPAMDKLRAIIDGPGVEPVAWRYKDRRGFLCYETTRKLIRHDVVDLQPLYLAAPSAPVQMSDDALMRRANANCIGNNCSTGTETVQMRWVFDLEALRDMMRSVPVQAVPDGMALVPIEPTPEMLEAGEREFRSYAFRWMLGHPAVWSVMLAAAPQPPKVIGE